MINTFCFILYYYTSNRVMHGRPAPQRFRTTTTNRGFLQPAADSKIRYTSVKFSMLLTMLLVEHHLSFSGVT